MPTTAPTLDVIAPITPALQRAKTMLFAPFDLSKWFAVGFCAWLAYLGEGWGGGHFNFSPHRHGRGGDWDGLRHFVVGNVVWLVPLVLFAVLVGLVVWLVFTWLSSRGHFMFLNAVARDTSDIAHPWQSYSQQGDSLFLFRILLGLVSLVVLAPFIAGAVVSVLAMVRAERVLGGGVLILACAACALLALIVLLLVIGKFLIDFVVPIMMLRRVKVMAGWHEFNGLVRAHPGAFLLYLLFQIVLQMVIGMLVLLVVIGTCCLAGCLLALPYIGTVFLLPILVFERAYSVYFLAQFGPAYDVFALASTPPTSPSTAPPAAPPA